MTTTSIEIVGGYHDGTVIAVQHCGIAPEEYILLKRRRNYATYVDKTYPTAEDMLRDIETDKITYVNTGRFRKGRWLFKEKIT